MAYLVAALQAYDLVIKTSKGTRASHVSLFLDLEEPLEGNEGTLSDEPECFVLTIVLESTTQGTTTRVGYADIIAYLQDLSFPEGLTAKQRCEIRRRSQPYSLIGDELY